MCGRCWSHHLVVLAGVMPNCGRWNGHCGSSRVLVLSPYYTEVISGYYMTCGVTMVIHRGGGLKMFFEPFSKCSWGFTKVLIMTIYPATPVPVNHPTFLVMKPLSLGATRMFLMAWPPLKYTWTPCYLQTF